MGPDLEVEWGDGHRKRRYNHTHTRMHTHAYMHTHIHTHVHTLGEKHYLQTTIIRGTYLRKVTFAVLSYEDVTR